MVNDGTIPCSVQNRGNRQFHGSFMPKEPITHLIQMKFNGRLLRGREPVCAHARALAQRVIDGFVTNSPTQLTRRTRDRGIWRSW